MNFNDSPFEKMMKQPTYSREPAVQTPAPEGTACHGCPYWRGIACVSCYRELLKAPEVGR